MKEIELRPGEVICKECNGTGKLENIAPAGFIAKQLYECPKCHGEGKLDWIEAVVGKKPKKIKAAWNVDYDINSMYPSMIDQYAVDNLSKIIKEKIDRDIVKSITGDWYGTK